MNKNFFSVSVFIILVISGTGYFLFNKYYTLKSDEVEIPSVINPADTIAISGRVLKIENNLITIEAVDQSPDSLGATSTLKIDVASALFVRTVFLEGDEYDQAVADYEKALNNYKPDPLYPENAPIPPKLTFNKKSSFMEVKVGGQVLIEAKKEKSDKETVRAVTVYVK